MRIRVPSRPRLPIATSLCALLLACGAPVPSHEAALEAQEAQSAGGDTSDVTSSVSCRLPARPIRRQINECIAAAIQGGLDREGRIDITFDIDPNGQVLQPHATRDEVRHPRLNRCLVAAFLAQTMPATGRTATMTYPIHLDLPHIPPENTPQTIPR